MPHRTQPHGLRHPGAGGAATALAVLTTLAALTALIAMTALIAACGASAPARSAAPKATTQGPAGGAGTGPAASQSPAAGQSPVPAESNPPGDIPDTTVFVPYRSTAGHFQLRVPEGWSRNTATASTAFSSNLNSITVTWMPMTAAPSVSGARRTTIPALRASTLAFRLRSVRAVRLAGGAAIEIIYEVNSKLNAVTGRQYRMVVERFELRHAGRGAVLSLASAVGSDNVDPWRSVSESFRWK
jgi:hypothetical protein